MKKKIIVQIIVCTIIQITFSRKKYQSQLYDY